MGDWVHLWIAVLHIPHQTRVKVQLKHGVDVEELKLVLLCNRRLMGKQISSIKHGLRWEVRYISPADIHYKILLKYIGDDVYILRTAISSSQWINNG